MATFLPLPLARPSLPARRRNYSISPWARPSRRNLSVQDKAGKRAFRRTHSAPKGHSSPFRHLCVQGTAAPAPPPCTLAKCAAPYGWRTAHLLSVLPPHNTCPPRKARAPFSAISPSPIRATALYFRNSPHPANAPPPVNATKPSRHCAHSGKTPESSRFCAAKGKSAGIHCAHSGKTPNSSRFRAAKGKSRGIYRARGDRNRHPQQSNTHAQKCENIKTSRPQEKVFPFHGGRFRENAPCLR